MDRNQYQCIAMAVFKNGPNGSFSGKVGSVVGYKWKGIDVIRGLPRKSHKPRSEARLANEQAMKLMMGALTEIKSFIRVSFHKAAEPLNMSAFNLALSINKKQALTGQYPDLKIDWTKFLVSQGNLPGVEGARAEWAHNGLRVTWQDNSGTGGAYRTDRLSVLIYSPELDQWFFPLEGTTRDAVEFSIAAKDYWIHREIQVFLCFMAFGNERISESQHIHVSAKPD